jgi:hypothetical protein
MSSEPRPEPSSAKYEVLCFDLLVPYLIVTYTTGMSQLKIINASQSSIHRFASLKRQLFTFNASIYFNKQCLKQKLTLTYAKITIPNTSPAYKFTELKVTTIRIKDEIKFLHTKKQKLNSQMYRLHLILANNWNNAWQHIQHTIEEKLQKEVQSRYRKLDKKLKKLTQLQTTTPHLKQDFHSRVINNTDITFTDHEMTLLQKGPKYSLHTKKKDWIQNLGLETETAISQLPPQTETYTENWLPSVSTPSYRTTTPKLSKTHTMRLEPSNPYKPNSITMKP